MVEEGGVPVSELRQRTSRFLQLVDLVSSRVSVTVGVSLILVVFMLINGFNGFPTRWQSIFSSVTDSIVIILLFSLKHT